MLSPVQAAKAVARTALQSDHPWNSGQREAARALLTSTNRVTALQGYAGTAKTTTVLATLRQWGASKAEVFTTQPLAIMAGDRIQFTRNDRELDRINGGHGTITAIDQQSRTATVRGPRGQTQTLNLDNTRDQHIRHAYVETAFAAQGRTADHVIIHADSKAANLVDQKSFYVSVSRARESVAIYTNDRAKLVSAINERAGLSHTAVSEAAIAAPAAGKSLGAGLG
ncbi:AAA family ATPase [Novosphingobium sp.]|uniref:AAA family ATPase n=1 Tax=Novosphingobium sp. TaxID=1874826 RepID=UPI0025F40431|nr:AAA family ATPase [Novosphingobium sp.]